MKIFDSLSIIYIFFKRNHSFVKNCNHVKNSKFKGDFRRKVDEIF